jgi:anti-anti-sigma factor
MQQPSRPAPISAPDRFPLYVRTAGDVVVLEVSALAPATHTRSPISLVVAGQLDRLTADGLRNTLVRLLRRCRPARVGIDLTDVTLMDASGVCALQRFAVAAAQVGTAVAVVNPPAGTAEALAATGLLEVSRLPTNRGSSVGARTGADGRPETDPRRHGRSREFAHAACRPRRSDTVGTTLQ